MSLSERAKGALRQAIEGPKEMLGPRAEEVMLKLGPVAIVDHIISNTVIPEASAALSENREEAERYVAGLLGMM